MHLFNFSLLKTIALITILSLPVFAQMPGWIKYNDMDGNTFLLDQNGKFYLDLKKDIYEQLLSVGLKKENI